MINTVTDEDDFIARLPLQPPLSEKERYQIRSLGAGSPLDLAALHRAAPREVEKVMGERAENILCQVLALLTNEEREQLEQPLPPLRGLGARLDPPPDIPIAGEDPPPE